ncbi:peptide MFS transporter [Kordiimonas pumila]|uniref:Peptide MFS transporter n=1 Tax=Kordiimonas pumila TaxID=2161677 RepID=A0ABV7D9P9_9PROT|nr:peptide MFS transporter [Kordiimonas pumila]
MNATTKNPDTAFLGHPKGLGYIVFTEAWERFSFYGMQALMVLYMSTYLFQHGTIEGIYGFSQYKAFIESIFGELSIRALSTQTFGLYIGFIYFMPVIGGLIGDQWLGQRKAVLAGAVAMAIGHFLMAFEAAFLFAMLSLIIGSGLLKGNLAAQVGTLYTKNDQRRDTAFSIYNVAVNVGATIAPLICGTLGELYGWHYGFGAAGIGMMIGIAVYVSGAKYLPDVVTEKNPDGSDGLQAGDTAKIGMLVLLFIITALFWIAQTQVWNTYPLWIKDHVDLEIFGTSMPITWFQSLDSFAVLVFAPIIMYLWYKQRQRSAEPEDVTKIIIGFLVFGAACVWLAVGQTLSADGKVAIFWPAIFHFICAAGFLYAWPAVMAMVSKTAPAPVNAMMVGACYLSIFAGSTTSGWLGRFYETLPATTFWIMHGAIVASAGGFIFLIRKPLAKILELETKNSKL